ncbi:MAG: hypothetical protein ACM3PF_06180 [Bacteroidota bacterium]
MNPKTIRTLAASAAATLTLVLASAAGAAGTTADSGKTSGSVSVGTVKVVTPASAGAPAPAATTAPAVQADTKPSDKAAATTPKAKKKHRRPAASAEKPDAAGKEASPTAPADSAKDDSKDGGKDEGKKGYTLKGGAERTDFRSLTIEGEDRVHVEIERPPLTLQLNPSEVKGLDFGTAQDVLDRVPPDLTTQYLAVSAGERTPYTGRPWLRNFASGAVARFQPNVRGTERWKLTVADSRGQTVAQFSGKGEAPREIVWDGRSTTGVPVTPGITYSYVFEGVDKAGNKRNFVGQGFKVMAYRLDSPLGPTLVFSAATLQEGAVATAYGPGGAATRPAPPIVLEAASTLNQSPRVSQPIRVNVTGRTYEYANATAKQVAAWLANLTIGDPARVQASAQVQPDAPEGGTVQIALDGVGVPMNTAPATRTPKVQKGTKSKKG